MEKEKLEKNKILKKIISPKRKLNNSDIQSSENIIILSDNEKKKASSNKKKIPVGKSKNKKPIIVEKNLKTKKIKKIEKEKIKKNFLLFDDISILFLMESKIIPKENNEEFLALLNINQSETKERYEEYLKNLTANSIKKIFSYIQKNGISKSKLFFDKKKQFESVKKDSELSENTSNLIKNFSNKQNGLLDSVNSFINECKTLTDYISKKEGED